ncbi:TRAP transporter small permease [Allopusillimonas ginsengisoli]|nr:TRAP transporter small permease [Allopusillimonas ginsengisoli]
MTMPSNPENSEARPADGASQHADIDTSPPAVSWLQRIEDGLVGSLGIAALLVCLVNVVLRNVGEGHSLPASDEIQVYLIVWAIFLSLGVITANNRHIKADIFLNWFSPGLKRAALVLSAVLGLVFSMIMTYLGLQIALEAFEFGDMSSTSLRFPLWMYTAALPAGMALMSLRYALHVARLVGRPGGAHA